MHAHFSLCQFREVSAGLLSKHLKRRSVIQVERISFLGWESRVFRVVETSNVDALESSCYTHVKSTTDMTVELDVLLSLNVVSSI